MLRSQSISNLNEQRKSKTGFLSSLRSRKSSSTDLHSKLISQPSNFQKNKPRPLSLSVSSINLNQKLQDSKDGSYTSNVSKQRLGSIEDKENIYGGSKYKTNRIGPPSFEGKTLKTRSSAPNLNKSKRNSMFSSSVSSHTPNINILPDAPSSKIDESPAESLFVSPETISDTCDPIYASPIHLELIDDEFSDDDLQARKLHRTTNLANINEFMKLVDEPDQYKASKFLPINNRKSLEFEKFERNKIKQSLQDNLDREASTNFISNLKLVENTMFLSIEKLREMENDFLLSLDDNDYVSSIKNDPYDNESDEYYLNF